MTKIAYIDAAFVLESKIAKLQDTVASTTTRAAAGAQNPQPMVQRISLLPVDLTSFDEDRLKWDSFRDLFHVMIKLGIMFDRKSETLLPAVLPPTRQLSL